MGTDEAFAGSIERQLLSARREEIRVFLPLNWTLIGDSVDDRIAYLVSTRVAFGFMIPDSLLRGCVDGPGFNLPSQDAAQLGDLSEREECVGTPIDMDHCWRCEVASVAREDDVGLCTLCKVQLQSL